MTRGSGKGSDSRTSSADPPAPSTNSAKHKQSSHKHQHSKKKRKLISASETETSNLTLIHCDSRASSAELPASSTISARNKKSSHKHHHSKKKRQLIVTSETETRTLTLVTTNSNPTSTSYSNTHARTRTSLKKEHHGKIIRRQRTPSEDLRQWTYSHRDLSNYKDRVVFVSYNILGVQNAAKHDDLYTNVPFEYLDWDYRKQLLHKEIRKYNAGILCFQEVDRFDDLEHLLCKDGFRGVYLARTGEACDGCAVFWRNELFTLLHEEKIQFQQFGLRDNVAQLCIFKLTGSCWCSDAKFQESQTAPAHKLVVGNTHLLFNPGRGDIKLGQMRMFLEKAQTLSSEWGNIPVVIGGDLNSLPKSAIYQFLASSELDVRVHDRRKVSGQICPVQNPPFQSRYSTPSRSFLHRWTEEELLLATGERRGSLLRHNLKLSSAYASVPGRTATRDNEGEPLATSFHSKFLGTVDYIWHSKELVPVRVLETLPINILRRSRGLPTQKWGSDHLALVCELAFVDDVVESECAVSS